MPSLSQTKGLVRFSDLLAAARPVGPTLDLADKLQQQPTLASPFSLSTAAGAYASGSSSLSASAVGSLPERAQQWISDIEAAASRYGLDANLLTALVWTESAFRPDAVSPAGAIGLGQLMPGTAGGLGVDPNDPVQNLDGAARYLRAQLDRFGSVQLALAAYNAGPGRVERSGGVPNIPETQAYVRIVSSRAEELAGGTS
ncbi:MAG: lytic transglycosylase domain-containing protein [Actinomycetia bacterium]|nr:lytic transglycosylase domain-containing protein [Actinomycetes bacterium]MCP4960841.1 lytic transglycosylase domain-containing protein [Actinomycetes bacterium]